jgi:hypothetical protein
VTQVFPTKRDGWLVAVLWIAGACLLGTAWIPVVARPYGAWGVVLSLVHVASAAFAFWVLYGTDYRVADRELLVRGGPFRWRIPLDAIVSVVPTRNPLSSPACSLDRLRIAYRGPHGERALMVSPADKPGFLAALAARGARAS